jgi:two-component system capsular synthesis sensor histidine kinase RcsC
MIPETDTVKTKHRQDISCDVSPTTIAALVAAGVEQVAVDASIPGSNPLLAEFAHDLRSPLATHLLLIDRLRKGQAGPISGEQDRLLQILHSAACAMAALANDAFDLARETPLPGGLYAAPFELAGVFTAVRTFVQPMAEERRLMLRFSSAAGGRRRGDARALQRVLLNLVINAIKYTDEGSVTVSAGVTTLEDGSEGVTFSVADTGRGMPAPIVEWIARPDMTHPFGTGFGLPLCERLLRTLDSTLCHEAPAGGGSRLTFTLRLPLEA